MFSDRQLRFMNSQPVARLATADRDGLPHVVPVCFVVDADTLYIQIDQKPKKSAKQPLKRVRNLQENPNATVIVDRYDDNWSKLAWLMLRGTAEILTDNEEYHSAQRQLRSRYPQYESMDLSGLPMIAIRIARVTQWGDV